MSCDVLVVGSGIAGLFFAVKAAEYADVLLVTKKDRPESSTNYAQGGIAAVFAADDSPEMHMGDTFVAGAGLCHPDAVGTLVREGPDRVRELILLGAEFTREAGALSLGREGGHSRRRIVRADDLTGREIERALLAAVADSPRIQVLEDHFALDLLLSAGEQNRANRCTGALVLGPRGEIRPFSARAVVLATGGGGQVYRHTTNPSISTGDGVAMASRAGAAIANMEFIQFHPTALFPAEAPTFLISEAVRGEGAVLRRRDGEEFMHRYHSAGALAPRDVVARAIDRELKESGDDFVLLDASALRGEVLHDRFPNIIAETAARGWDMSREPIPVVPAAHYLCGGVLTDRRGRTSLPGLFAIGETACTGVHGANRLASNSLLEALVFAGGAAEELRTRLLRRSESQGEPAAEPALRAAGEAQRAELRSLMWNRVGIVRSDEQLTEAGIRIADLRRSLSGGSPAADIEAAEHRNLLEIARLIALCASWRRESRGLHFNLDHPFRDNERFLRDTIVLR